LSPCKVKIETLNWDDIVDRDIVRPYLLKELEEKVVEIKYNLKVSPDRLKIYLNNNMINIKWE